MILRIVLIIVTALQCESVLIPSNTLPDEGARAGPYFLQYKHVRQWML